MTLPAGPLRTVRRGAGRSLRGDRFGCTINIAARIGDYARPGEVLVSAEVVAADRDPAVRYDPIGPSRSRAERPLTLYTAARS
jgi:class 3 adenylate cyclase